VTNVPENFLDTITTGDARLLSAALPDESVDLIFTDPVYDRIEDYQWLSELAMRVLKPDSAALVWCGIGFLPETLEALGTHLQYKWLMPALRPTGVHSAYCMKNVFSNWRCAVWFEKGKAFPERSISDVGYSNDNGTLRYHGAWDKSFRVTHQWLYGFTNPAAIILDPFTGGGTVPAVCKMLSRHYVAFEIDPDTAERARERVQNTQPPLPGLEVEQAHMELTA
jgi:hypothetical protein